jgi:hypothetical protein
MGSRSMGGMPALATSYRMTHACQMQLNQINSFRSNIHTLIHSGLELSTYTFDILFYKIT